VEVSVSSALSPQALLQVLQPQFYSIFSDASYGIRRGQRARENEHRVQAYEGRRFVVGLYLEKFFDRVNHDVLMGRLAKRMPTVSRVYLRRDSGERTQAHDSFGLI
jgi:RNA-directed DNA polymerase